MSKLRVLAALCLFALSCAIAQTASAQAVVSPTVYPPPDAIYQRFIGHWTGTLEYRDYSSKDAKDKHVTLPTNLEVALNADGNAMQFHYTYDDGPGKTVRESETISIDLAMNRYLVVSEDGKDRDSYQVAGLDQLQGDTPAHLILEGKGEENGKAVDVRTTIDVSYKSFSILRETKMPGAEFMFRHQYKFERVAEVTPVK